MSLFSQPDSATRVANQIKQAVIQQRNSLLASGVNANNLLWGSKDATPEAILAALGTDAGKIFALANLNIQTVVMAAQIDGVAAPVLPGVPSNYTATVNPDGSVTATKKA